LDLSDFLWPEFFLALLDKVTGTNALGFERLTALDLFAGSQGACSCSSLRDPSACHR